MTHPATKPHSSNITFVLAPCALLLGLACNKASPQPTESGASASAPDAAAVVQPAQAAPTATPVAPTTESTSLATLGQPAPDFTLPDLDGKAVSMSEFKGKRVVLEWFNPGCPFVKAAHTEGSLVDAAKKASDKGVVWIAINSNAPGKQGHGVDANRQGRDAFGISHPVLLDESGEVGKTYGATNTPHMFVIDEKGTLVYAGAIDNSPDGEGKTPSDGRLVSYVAQALAELDAGKPVSVSQTKAYGCSVKYGS